MKILLAAAVALPLTTYPISVNMYRLRGRARGKESKRVRQTRKPNPTSWKDLQTFEAPKSSSSCPAPVVHLSGFKWRSTVAVYSVKVMSVFIDFWILCCLSGW